MNYRVRIKMCGMTRMDDISMAVSLGVDALGFIFYAASPRHVSITKAKRLIDAIPPFVQSVGVLVNPDVKFVEQLLAELPLGCLQFHGDESPAFCSQFKLPYIKAIPAIDRSQIEQHMMDYSQASGILVDTPAPGIYGGAGKRFDWTMVPPRHCTQAIMLAGGLNALNVQEAVALVQPYAVDVCSGVEARPGIKDHAKMKSFVSALTLGGDHGEKK